MKIDQGSIIFGVKSELYLNIACAAFIISASCDIENCKTPFFYYITAVPIDKYCLTKRGFESAFREHINGYSDFFHKNCLDLDTLSTWSREDAEKAINSIEKGKNGTILKKYNEYIEYEDALNDIEKRKKYVCEKYDKVKKYLMDIDRGKWNNLYLLPVVVEEKGLLIEKPRYILDFLDINRIKSQYIELIVKHSGLDYEECLEDQIENDELKKLFYLESDLDYVYIDHSIPSPRREHIMQRFSFSFSRIGIERIGDHHLTKLKEQIEGE